jgi:UV DNA damage endonuclease
MRIGYACLTVGVPGTGFRTCTARNATPDVLSELIGSNLRSLDNILDYNINVASTPLVIISEIIDFR